MGIIEESQSAGIRDLTYLVNFRVSHMRQLSKSKFQVMSKGCRLWRRKEFTYDPSPCWVESQVAIGLQ